MALPRCLLAPGLGVKGSGLAAGLKGLGLGIGFSIRSGFRFSAFFHGMIDERLLAPGVGTLLEEAIVATPSIA